MTQLISAVGLSKTYGSASAPVVALENLDFEIRQGAFVSIVGPSGCGKSTLLRALAGLQKPSSGTLRMGGDDINGPSPRVGFVFQSPVLLPWKTILENVLFPVEIRLGRVGAFRERAMSLLAMAGIADFAAHYPHELSGGMQQRAGIVRALVQDPEILLMDEPFGALDAMTREQMNLELLQLWAGTGKTVVFVTHSIPEAVFLSDRVIAMTARPGRIAEIIDIDLPRPRDLQVINTPGFGTYAARLRAILNARQDIAG